MNRSQFVKKVLFCGENQEKWCLNLEILVSESMTHDGTHSQPDTDKIGKFCHEYHFSSQMVQIRLRLPRGYIRAHPGNGIP